MAEAATLQAAQGLPLGGAEPLPIEPAQRCGLQPAAAGSRRPPARRPPGPPAAAPAAAAAGGRPPPWGAAETGAAGPRWQRHAPADAREPQGLSWKLTGRNTCGLNTSEPRTAAENRSGPRTQRRGDPAGGDPRQHTQRICRTPARPAADRCRSRPPPQPGSWIRGSAESTAGPSAPGAWERAVEENRNSTRELASTTTSAPGERGS